MASVRPLRAIAPPPARPVPERPESVLPPSVPMRAVRPAPPPRRAVPVKTSSAPTPGVTLDGSWDRQIAKGVVVPDSTLDLHGHTLHSAHSLLDTGLERAIARGDRVLLLVTGRPPRPESERPHARGAIRAAVADWLAGSRHAGAIAAVRGAHPRHGGAGALYLVFRRPRPARNLNP
ncbi:Smr/MutS family protein [uncultured Sphingomonas sp.]|uniref:Smr/MutS family protein n=1 Tax=uncultured Sphingomonas sp. TaxID=158754 RepID=UPI0035CA2CE4